MLARRASVILELTMDDKAKLRVPAALAVVVLAGCGTPSPAPADASTDTPVVVADAGPADAGCVPPEVYDPVAMMCIPIV